MGAAGTVYRDNKKAVGFGLTALGVLVLGLIVYLVFKVIKPGADTAESLGKTAANTAKGLENASSGIPALGQGVGDTTGAVGFDLSAFARLLNPTVSNGPTPTAEDRRPGFKNLTLTGRTEKKNRALLKDKVAYFWVTDAETSRPVPATLHIHPKGPIANLQLGNTQVDLFDGLAERRIEISARDLPFIDYEADFEVFATAPGYNPSTIYTVE